MDQQPPGDPVWTVEQAVSTEVGSAETDNTSDYPAAVLWVPDVEAKRGWREFYVRKAAPKRGARMGYRK